MSLIEMTWRASSTTRAWSRSRRAARPPSRSRVAAAAPGRAVVAPGRAGLPQGRARRLRRRDSPSLRAL